MRDHLGEARGSEEALPGQGAAVVMGRAEHRRVRPWRRGRSPLAHTAQGVAKTGQGTGTLEVGVEESLLILCSSL